MFWRWVLSFFDVNGDSKLSFADLSVLVSGVVFTLLMLGLLPAAPTDPVLWGVFMGSIGTIAGITKLAEVMKR